MRACASSHRRRSHPSAPAWRGCCRVCRRSLLPRPAAEQAAAGPAARTGCGADGPLLPGRTGLEALSDIRLRARYPGGDDDHARRCRSRARCAGSGRGRVRGQDAAPQELELALRAAHAGQVFLSPQISAKMLAPMLGREAHRHRRAVAAPARSCAASARVRATGNRRRPRHQRQDGGDPRTHDGIARLPPR